MRQLPKNLAIIFPFFTVIILDAMGTGMMLPILAPLINAKHGVLSGYGKAEQHLLYGVILGAWPFCFMLGAPIFGYLSDHWGRKRILLICLAGSFVSFVFYIASFRYSWLASLLAGRVIGGVTSGSQGVAQAAIADVSTGKEKAVNIAVIALAMTIGLIVGPLLGGVFSDADLISWFSNQTPFYVAGIFALFNILLLSKFLNEKPLKPKEHDIFERLTVLLRHHQLLILLAVFFCFELAWSLYFQSLALLLAQYFHFSNAMIGIFSSYVGLALSIGLLVIVRVVVKSLTLPQTIYRGLWLAFLSLLIVFFLRGVVFQWIFAAFIAVGVAICYATMIALASDLIGEGQGLLMGLTDAILALAFSITGFLSGLLAYVSPAFPQLAAAIFMLGAITIFYFFYGRQL